MRLFISCIDRMGFRGYNKGDVFTPSERKRCPVRLRKALLTVLFLLLIGLACTVSAEDYLLQLDLKGMVYSPDGTLREETASGTFDAYLDDQPLGKRQPTAGRNDGSAACRMSRR